MLAEVNGHAPEVPAGRERVNRLQEIAASLPQVELQTAHLFAGEMYARVVTRPAGTLIVGKVHREPHFYVVARGRVAVNSGDGTDAVIHEAGTVIVSQPGTKRAVWALEDSVCLTVHHVGNARDLEMIEAALIEQDGTPCLYDASNRVLPGVRKEIAQ